MSHKSFQKSMEWDDIMFDSKHSDGNVEWDNFSATGTFDCSNDNDIRDNDKKSEKKRSGESKSSNKETLNRSNNKEENVKSKRKESSVNSTRRSRSPPVVQPKGRKETSAKTCHASRSSSISRLEERKRTSTRDEDLESESIRRKNHKKKNDTLPCSAPKDEHRNEAGHYSMRNDDSDSSGEDGADNRMSSNSNNKLRQKADKESTNNEKRKTPTQFTRDSRNREESPQSNKKDRPSDTEGDNKELDSRKATNGVDERKARKNNSVNDDEKTRDVSARRSRTGYNNDSNDEDEKPRCRDVSVRKCRTVSNDEKVVDNTSSQVRDTSRARQRRGQINAEQLSQSRQRAVQRAEARNNWREAQRVDSSKQQRIKSASTGTSDDDQIDERRTSLLDQSRRGPIRSFRVDDDDDDDDFSIFSSISSSSFTVEDSIDAPFIRKNIRHSTSGSLSNYLPNGLNNSNKGESNTFQKQERRPSAFGTGHDRAKAIYTMKSELEQDTSDDESCTTYALPTGLSRSNGIHFEIDRSSKAGASARRPSLSTTLVVPCINGIDDNSIDGTSNDQPSKSDRRSSLNAKPVDYESDSNSKKAGANYDSTVEDMLKSRRLRGARGDAAKKKDEKKSEKKSRRISVAMLSNLVQSMTTPSEQEKLTAPSSHRRASTAL